MPPKVTVAVLSWNRLHYLRATLESARRCIRYPALEWIVSDNESEEPGLSEYLSGLGWVDRLLRRRQSHAEAMNEIVACASGEFLILWPEDVQFVVEGEWLADMVELLAKHPEIGSVNLDALRRGTLERLCAAPGWGDLPRLARELYWHRAWPRRSRSVRSARGLRLLVCDGRLSGVCPSGIPSLTRTETWRRLGPWRASASAAGNLVDSSLGAETRMLDALYLSRLRLQGAVAWIPVAADIVTDPLGCKAKVRRGRRYGVYMPPQSADGWYYRIRPQADLRAREDRPLSFSEVVEPLGFRMPTDAGGDRLKFSLNDSVVFDIAANAPVPYPLADR